MNVTPHASGLYWATAKSIDVNRQRMKRRVFMLSDDQKHNDSAKNNYERITVNISKSRISKPRRQYHIDRKQGSNPTPHRTRSHGRQSGAIPGIRKGSNDISSSGCGKTDQKADDCDS